MQERERKRERVPRISTPLSRIVQLAQLAQFRPCLMRDLLQYAVIKGKASAGERMEEK